MMASIREKFNDKEFVQRLIVNGILDLVTFICGALMTFVLYKFFIMPY